MDRKNFLAGRPQCSHGEIFRELALPMVNINIYIYIINEK